MKKHVINANGGKSLVSSVRSIVCSLSHFHNLLSAIQFINCCANRSSEGVMYYGSPEMVMKP